MEVLIQSFDNEQQLTLVLSINTEAFLKSNITCRISWVEILRILWIKLTERELFFVPFISRKLRSSEDLLKISIMSWCVLLTINLWIYSNVFKPTFTLITEIYFAFLSISCNQLKKVTFVHHRKMVWLFLFGLFGLSKSASFKNQNYWLLLKQWQPQKRVDFITFRQHVKQNASV